MSKQRKVRRRPERLIPRRDEHDELREFYEERANFAQLARRERDDDGASIDDLIEMLEHN
jgi:ribosome-binding protein aMBF1 (putative translation factor)